MNKRDICLKANHIRTELLGSNIPVNVREICNLLGILLYEKPITAEAYFVSKEGKIAVIVKESASEQRKRFSIAHELGHILIPSHTELVFSCSYGDMQLSTKKPFELEANYFASELLIPSHGLLDGIREDIGIDTILQMAEMYNVSMSAMAIKLAETTSNSMAVFYIEKGKVRWVCKSESFDYKVNTAYVEDRSIYWKLVNNNEMRAKKKKVDGSVWLVDEYDVDLTEEVIYFPQYDMALAIVNQTDD